MAVHYDHDTSTFLKRAYQLLRSGKKNMPDEVKQLPGVLMSYNPAGEGGEIRGFTAALHQLHPRTDFWRVDFVWAKDTRSVVLFVKDIAAFREAMVAKYPEAVAAEVMES